MYHTVEFAMDLHVALARSPRDRLEPVRLRRGDRLAAQLRPHVVESDYGPVEVADLFFVDGTAAYDVPFASFHILD
jgi:hypothetical protein